MHVGVGHYGHSDTHDIEGVGMVTGLPRDRATLDSPAATAPSFTALPAAHGTPASKQGLMEPGSGYAEAAAAAIGASPLGTCTPAKHGHAPPHKGLLHMSGGASLRPLCWLL